MAGTHENSCQIFPPLTIPGLSLAFQQRPEVASSSLCAVREIQKVLGSNNLKAFPEAVTFLRGTMKWMHKYSCFMSKVKLTFPLHLTLGG